MYNDIVWQGTENKDQWEYGSQTVPSYVRKLVIGLSWGLDQKKNDTEHNLINPTNPGTEWL